MFIYVIYLQISAHNSIVSTKYRFKFFALRDRLAMLVCEGSLSESSWEYKYIVDALNYHISAVEKVSIFEVVEAMVKFHTSAEEDKAVSKLQKTVSNKAVKSILDEYMLTAQLMIERNSKWQLIFIKSAIRFVKYFGISPSEQARATVVNPKPALSAIANHRSALQSIPLAA
jgi:hypothetical protein